MSSRSVALPFGSAHYESIVYVNGVEVVRHIGGHLPFAADVTKHLNFGANNRITVALNNILTPSTVPQGTITYKNDTQLFPKGFYETTTNFDFMNYAVAEAKGYSGSITIPNAILWWPYTTNSNPRYLYTLRVSLVASGKTADVYYQRVGIRTVRATDKEVLINGKPFYFRGFGKHEDANGKGLDLAFIAKDMNLIKWIGANSFRTSHYPYRGRRVFPGCLGSRPESG
ncbi:unnamed protein product [Medioppia subpectinata]|uniref:Beta-glucuronidase n=1 Tax=Medioppia subpectinata TaxID=1979941 RepID=A0A7R9KDE7_9ACAR|nr:unnamed protein product [Medioppia subpectinata]CAG2101465.1 unnamed protein product [Medioppia subpectinata]